LYNVLLYVQMYEAPLGRGGGGTVSLHPCPKWAVAIKRVISKLYSRISVALLVAHRTNNRKIGFDAC